MFVSELEKKIFESPASKISDKLVVISGYIGPETIAMLNEFPNKEFVIIYGMYAAEGIKKIFHDKFIELEESLKNVKILYSLVPVHSKIYCWSKDDVITEVLVGSANFSINGIRKDFKETLYPISSLAYEDYTNYRDFVMSRCIDCHNATKFKMSSSLSTKESQPYVGDGICRINLLDAKNAKVPEQSGLNWGDSKGHVTKGDAYLPIKVPYIKTFPELFPQKKYVDESSWVKAKSKKGKYRQNDDVEFIWDDKTSMIGLLEGTQTIDGVVFPNKLCTSNTRKELGDYIRGRIEKKLGKKVYNASALLPITKDILEQYGRTHIDISKIGDGVYYLDFSVK